MRIKTFGLAIGIIVCILLLFSILLFAPAAEPSKEYPIIHENDKVLPSGYLTGNETEELIDNGNGTVTILLYPVSSHTGKKAPVLIDNVTVVWGYGYAKGGKMVINEIKLLAPEQGLDASISLQDNGNGKIHISAVTTLGYYETDGYVRHPLNIRPAIRTSEVFPAILYPPIGDIGNESAGIVSRLMPVRAGNETVYVQGFEKHRVGPAMLWKRVFGNGSASAILKTDDGSYLIAGHKEVQVRGSAGDVQVESRAWLGKVNTNGALQWEHVYNGSGIQALLQHDGDYVATGNIGGSLWLLETDASGNVLIDRSYNNSTIAFAGVSIAPIGDEGYMIAGNAERPTYPYHAFVARADNNLTLLWNKDLSGYGLSFGNAIISTKDGNFVVCGGEDGDIAKIDADGNVLWNTTLGEHVGLLPVSILQANGGGYMAAYLDVTAAWPQGIIVSKLTSGGTTEWSKTFYGAGSAYVSAMSPAGDGGYVISGYTNGFASGLYVLKIDDTGRALWSAVYNQGAAGPIVRSDDGGYVMAASSGPQIMLMKFSSIIR